MTVKESQHKFFTGQIKYMEKLLSPACLHISNTTHFCKGCFRTREEISRWRYMSFEEQKRVIKKLHERGETNSGVFTSSSFNKKKINRNLLENFFCWFLLMYFNTFMFSNLYFVNIMRQFN